MQKILKNVLIAIKEFLPLESCKVGILEGWKIGKLEDWKVGIVDKFMYIKKNSESYA